MQKFLHDWKTYTIFSIFSALSLFATPVMAGTLATGIPAGSGGGSQTPWTSDIDGGSFSLSNVSNINADEISAGLFAGDGSQINDIQCANLANFPGFDCSGNAIGNVTIPNGLSIFMNGSTISDGSFVSIDPLDRFLFGNNQFFSAMNYSGILGNASISFDGIGNVSISTTVVDGNDVVSADFNNRQFYDSSHALSDDYSNRLLYDTSGIVSADYGGRSLTGPGGAVFFDWSGLYNLSAAISNDSGNVAMNYNLSMHASSILDGDNNESIDPDARTLSNGEGGNILLDYSGSINNSVILSFDLPNSTIHFSNMPTSCSGLPSGDVANVAGILNICP